MKNCIIVLVHVYFVFFIHVPSSAENLVLVTAKESNYSILVDPDAPKTVALAARELQSYLEKISGKELAIVSSSNGPLIALGDNAITRAADLPDATIAADGFRIVTHQGNLLIYGHDTREGELDPENGFSRGTLFGAYALLEDVLGVRWFMPGPSGEYVPQTDRIEIEAIDQIDAPDFR